MLDTTGDRELDIYIWCHLRDIAIEIKNAQAKEKTQMVVSDKDHSFVINGYSSGTLIRGCLIGEHTNDLVQPSGQPA